MTDRLWNCYRSRKAFCPTYIHVVSSRQAEKYEQRATYISLCSYFILIFDVDRLLYIKNILCINKAVVSTYIFSCVVRAFDFRLNFLILKRVHVYVCTCRRAAEREQLVFGSRFLLKTVSFVSQYSHAVKLTVVNVYYSFQHVYI